MKSDRTGKPKNELGVENKTEQRVEQRIEQRVEQRIEQRIEQRVELKYCEGCGGLGVRECGGGRVYCDDCTRKLAELAVSKKTSRRPTLPVGNRSLLDECADSSSPDGNDDSNESDSGDLDAMAWISAGGAA
ncbi:MAG TPA: hypothetical protein VKR60_05490 [Candidatus Sulfotelmatobacter sp.]|nr:hypothetical protein [Candidatus Sulfotelmatobacter sp.]